MGKITNYNYKADPYFADLFQEPTMAKDVFTAFNNQQTYDAKQLQLEEAQKKADRQDRTQGLEDALIEKIKTGGANDSQILDEYQRLALESGDINTYLNISKQKESFKDGDEKEKWNQFKLLKDVDPTLASKYFNENLSSKYGMVDPSNMSDLFISDGMVYDKNTLKPGQRIAPSSRDRKEADPNKRVAGNQIWTDASGKNFTTVNLGTPDGANKAIQLRSAGWKPDKETKSSGLDLVSILAGVNSNNRDQEDTVDVPSPASSVPGPVKVIEDRQLMPSAINRR